MVNNEQLFSIMREQNYWFKEVEEDYTPREQYLKAELIGSKSILVIKGPRRAGKTVLLKLIIKFLFDNGIKKEQILYLNLEDYRLSGDCSLDLLERVLSVYSENINPGQYAYFLIDEIQNIDGFERFLRTKYDSHKSRIKFIITGSNARLLSREIGTLLTGRASTIEVLPFSFEEFARYSKIDLGKKSYYHLEPKKSRLKGLFNKYVRDGAIPEFFDERNAKARLIEYFENVLYRDIVERFKVRNPKVIKELAVNLATNSSKLFSINQLTKTFKVSINTLQEYLSYLEMSYLFFYLDKSSFSVKEKVTSQSKAYCIDTGLINAVSFKFSEDSGRMLENVVFIHLKRNSEEVYYFKEKKECDFVVKKGNKMVKAIQVAKSLDDKATKEREIAGLLEAMGRYKLTEGLILTENQFEDIRLSRIKIKVRPVWFWLLNTEE